MNILFETKRLVVRRFEENDLNNLYLLLSNKDVMRYLEKPFTMERTKEFLFYNGLIDVPRIYAVEQNKTFIGYTIYHDYDVDSIEIGWVLLPDFWNYGFASELTEAMIRMTKRNNKKVIIECDKKQTATISIAIKFGFSLVECDGNLCVFKLP